LGENSTICLLLSIRRKMVNIVLIPLQKRPILLLASTIFENFAKTLPLIRLCRSTKDVFTCGNSPTCITLGHLNDVTWCPRCKSDRVWRDKGVPYSRWLASPSSVRIKAANSGPVDWNRQRALNICSIRASHFRSADGLSEKRSAYVHGFT
jgi:hypothetical protein